MNDANVSNVVVVGSGFGGLEAAFYLRKRLGRRARVTIVSEHDIPQRFTAGQPFHAGASWAVMEAGVKMMAGVFSD